MKLSFNTSTRQTQRKCIHCLWRLSLGPTLSLGPLRDRCKAFIFFRVLFFHLLKRSTSSDYTDTDNRHDQTPELPIYA